MAVNRLYTTEGIVLKQKSSGDTDKIVTLLTKEFGKIRVLAKGVRRITSRRRGHLVIFNFVKLALRRGKIFDTVTEASTLGNAAAFNDLQKICSAYAICELVERLVPEQVSQENIFFLTQKCLQLVSESVGEEERRIILENFSRELLVNLGYIPEQRELSGGNLISFIENIIERPLYVPQLLVRIQRT